MPEELFLAPPSPLEVTSQIRSTWVLASLQTIRDKGHGDAYLEHLPREHHDTITLGVASQWFPLDVVTAHYRACDALGFTPEQQVTFGREVSVKMQRTILGTAVRMAKNAGVTPWTIYKQLDRFWQRIAVGGGIAVHKLGPKEARAELLQCPLLELSLIHI